MNEHEMRLLVDGHLDLGLSALHVRRDLTQPVATVRAHDAIPVMQSFGSCTVTLPALRQGHVGIVFATVMSRIDPSDRWTQTGMYCQEQCYAVGRGHLAYYQALARAGEVHLIHTTEDLDQVVEAWQQPERHMPVGIVLTMESADPILNPEQVPEWYALGLRMVGIAHYGVGAYTHGTATEGGLLPRARPLLHALATAGIIVDMTHLTDQAFWEVLEAYEGPIAASHHNCRALVGGQRQLTDDMIMTIAQRDGVIGTACDVWMLDPDWQRGVPAYEQTTKATLETVADHLDYIAQLTGSASHCAIGSDLDGGFGTEQAPRDLNTIADLARLATILAQRGFTEADIDAVFSGNWVRLLKNTWRSRP